MAQCCQSDGDTLLDTCWEQAVKQSTYTDRQIKNMIQTDPYLMNVLLLLLRAGRLDAVPGQVVVRGQGGVGVVAGLHAEEPWLVHPEYLNRKVSYLVVGKEYQTSIYSVSDFY